MRVDLVDLAARDDAYMLAMEARDVPEEDLHRQTLSCPERT
jgi:hypothetical protein